MTRWTATTLGDPFGPGWLHPSDPVLFACGLGFGVAIAPVNASILASVRDQMHGLASALVVVARMIGMLVGISYFYRGQPAHLLRDRVGVSVAAGTLSGVSAQLPGV